MLTYTPSDAQTPVSIVITIGQPRWNARRATWTFPATRNRKQPDDLPGTSVRIKPPSIPNPRSFKRATLLIDDAANNSYCTRGNIDYLPPEVGEDSPWYARAKGELIPTAEWFALYSIVGTKFGGIAGQYFDLPNLPDLQPNLAPYVCMTGIQSMPDGPPTAQCLAGNVQLTSETDFVANGWLPADGSLVPVAEYPILYSQIGAAFGSYGAEYFRLPKLAAPSGLQNIICADGTGWDAGAYSPYQCTVGEVDLFATTSWPGSELLADGRLLQIRDATQLFTEIGNPFGSDGVQTFRLPDPPVPLNGTSWGICAQGTSVAPWA